EQADERADEGGPMSDEMLQPPPEVAREVFTGEMWERAEAFAGMLAGPAVVRGLLGPREIPRIWDRHLLNCAVVAEAIPPGVSLEEAGAELKLDNVEVLRGRAEELAGKRVFDIASARAVAPLDRLLVWAMPLLREGGELLAMKGERAAEELEDARDQLQKCGAARAELISVGRDKVEPPATLVRVVAGRPPRRVRQASRRRRKR